jgi:anti-anti-sigma factor
MADVTAREGVAVLAFHGELDLEALPEVKRRLREACESSPREVVVDLADVTFVAIRTLATFLDYATRLRDNGCPLVIVNASATTRGLVSISDLGDVLEIRGT